MKQYESHPEFASILTTADRQLYVERIDQMKSEAFTLQKIQEEAALDAIDREIRAYITSAVSNSSSSGIEKALDRLKNELMQLEEVGVQLAFLPTRRDLKKMSESLHRMTNRATVLRVSVVPEIWGGVILELNGRLEDRSLRSYIMKSMYGSI